MIDYRCLVRSCEEVLESRDPDDENAVTKGLATLLDEWDRHQKVSRRCDKGSSSRKGRKTRQLATTEQSVF